MFIHERPSMSAPVGSNTDRVLRQAPCPVLVARRTVINGKVHEFEG